MNLSARLFRLEANLSPDTVRVVEGHSDSEIDEIATGKAYPGDLFVGLLRFAGGSHELA